MRLTYLGRFTTDLWKRLQLKVRKDTGHMYIGWQGRGNIGDDAVYLGLQKLRPDIAWLPILEGRKLGVANTLGLNEKYLAKGAVLGGGTTISMAYYLRQALQALESGIPVWCCGAGVGSSGWEQEAEPDLSDWADVLKRFKGIGVRGPLSFQKLQQLGVEGTEIVGDLALPLAVDKLCCSRGSTSLAVNVSLPSERCEFPADKMIQAIADVARRWQENGYRILPLALDQRDLKPLQAFCRQAGIGRSRIIFTNPVSIIEAVGACTALIGVRLHSAVLAVCAGVPPVLLGYRDKCLDFMLSMDLESMYIPLTHETVLTLEERIEEKIQSIQQLNELKEPVHHQAKSWAKIQKNFVNRMIDA